MALVVEDGTEVAGANSYVSDSDFTTYAANKGYTVPSGAGDREILLLKAMDKLADIEQSFQGYRVSSTQALGFPRKDVVLHGWLLASDTIPDELKNAQMELANYAQTVDLLTNESLTAGLTGFNVQGVYSETYDGSASRTQVIVGKANAFLKHLLKSATGLTRV